MRPQRLHAVLALLFLSLFLSLGTGYAIYYRLLAVTTLVLAGSALWAHLNLWGTRITFQRTFGKLQVGESVDSRITIHNSAPLPKLGLEIEDMPELPGHNSGAVVNVPGAGELTLASSIPLRHRGIYQVGAPTVTSSDPFSFVRLRRRNPGEQQFVVYPYMVEIPPFSITRGEIVGEGNVQGSSPEATSSVSTIRDYQPGDSSKYIHWPSTARKGNFMVKQFDTGMEDLVWILLDLHGESHYGEGPESTEEYAITAAASVARSYSEAAWAVGLMAQGDRSYIMAPQEGAPALDRLLLALTEARAHGNLPFRELLTLWHSQISSQAVSLVVVTPSVDPAWIPLLESLIHQGISATVVVVDPKSFGDRRDPGLVLNQLNQRGTPIYLLQHNEDIAQSLRYRWRSAGNMAPSAEVSGARA